MKHEFVFILGPCVIESRDHTLSMADKLEPIVKRLKKENNIVFYFKASYDKANRSSNNSFRGPGLDTGLKILEEVKNKYNFLLTSDVHEVSQLKAAAQVLDLIQIPAFLSRQTDLIVGASKTGKKVNIKKGQFLSPMDVKNILEKTDLENLYITERGSNFGYNNLLVDMSVFPYLKQNFPKLKVIFDATHSTPSIYGTRRDFVAPMAKSAVASGCVDGIFMETHDNPEKALCDGTCSINLNNLEALLIKILKINELSREGQNERF